MSARPGELKARWSKREHDILYSWGAGVPKPDSHLLHDVLTSERPRRDIARGWNEWVFDPSFVAELERRGYDLTTLRFSIRKKAAPSQEPTR